MVAFRVSNDSERDSIHPGLVPVCVRKGRVEPVGGGEGRQRVVPCQAVSTLARLIRNGTQLARSLGFSDADSPVFSAKPMPPQCRRQPGRTRRIRPGSGSEADSTVCCATAEPGRGARLCHCQGAPFRDNRCIVPCKTLLMLQHAKVGVLNTILSRVIAGRERVLGPPCP